MSFWGAISGFFIKILDLFKTNILMSDINCVMVLARKAFGPDGLKHFSELSVLEQQQLLSRVPILEKNHSDYPEGLRWIPRSATAFVGPRPPIIDGNTSDSKPIPNPGHWFVTRGYFAYTSPAGLHVRFGFRYDDIDDYFEFPSFTIKEIKI